MQMVLEHVQRSWAGKQPCKNGLAQRDAHTATTRVEMAPTAPSKGTPKPALGSIPLNAIGVRALLQPCIYSRITRMTGHQQGRKIAPSQCVQSKNVAAAGETHILQQPDGRITNRHGVKARCAPAQHTHGVRQQHTALSNRPQSKGRQCCKLYLSANAQKCLACARAGETHSLQQPDGRITNPHGVKASCTGTAHAPFETAAHSFTVQTPVSAGSAERSLSAKA